MLQTAAMHDCSQNLVAHLRLRCSLHCSSFYAFPSLLLTRVQQHQLSL